MKHFIINVDKNNTSNGIDDLKAALDRNFFNKYSFLKPKTSSIFEGVTMKRRASNNIFCENGYIGFDSRPVITNNGATYITLNNGNFSIARDNYDFMIGDTPVKFYDRFVQVGLELIPRDVFPMCPFYNGNRNVVNKTVIEIIIKITKKSYFI